jgi:hypothetical protein
MTQLLKMIVSYLSKCREYDECLLHERISHLKRTLTTIIEVNEGFNDIGSISDIEHLDDAGIK